MDPKPEKDKDGTIIDGLVYWNGDTWWTTINYADNLVDAGQWNSNESTASVNYGSNAGVKRKFSTFYLDTNTNADWEIVEASNDFTPGAGN